MNAPLTVMSAAPDRTHFIGGSDAAAILGISPWKSPLQLWQQKTQPFVEDSSPGRMKVLTRGKRMEPYVVDLLAEEAGLTILTRGARYIDREHGFLAAEIDAETATENVEIKTVSPFKAADWGELGTDAIPAYYTAQAQHGLMITGRVVCIFGVLIGGDDFRIYRVERDDKIIEWMRALEVSFWRDHVLPKVPPPAVSGEDVARLYPRDSGAAVEADGDTLDALDTLRRLKVQAKDIDAAIDERQAVIQRFLGPAARLTSGGRDVLTWKAQDTRRFDQTAFKAAHPELHEQFTKTTTSRVMRIR